jgi:outer membrane cobalamin receptor
MIQPITDTAWIATGRKLERMADQGESVTLTWDEATEQWEVSWVTGGTRYTSDSVSPFAAARRVEDKAWFDKTEDSPPA